MVLLTAWLLCVVSPRSASNWNSVELSEFVFMETRTCRKSKSDSYKFAWTICSNVVWPFFLKKKNLSSHDSYTAIENTRNKERIKKSFSFWNDETIFLRFSLHCPWNVYKQGRDKGYSCATNRHGGQKALAALSPRRGKAGAANGDKLFPLHLHLFQPAVPAGCCPHVAVRQTDRQWDRETDRFPVKTRQNVSLAQTINGNIWICFAVLCTSRNVINICN